MSDLGGNGMSDWMVDTFIYTALLIGIVLMVRRPVTRHFGPQIAYALWALPLLRFIMPPIVLPAWMAPSPEPVAGGEAVPAMAEPLIFILPEAGAAEAAAPAAGFLGTDLLIPLWLAGAIVFVGWRARDYFRMRRDLLAEARPVGDSGKIRLVETPAVSAPVAFGIRDKVVALPVDFMALLDVDARDMAIAHELEHHRGHDLLANIAAQPLLALHWFNPLAWWGWRAMRRDQEAACDARVVAGRARSERAAYAEVIAGFAAGEHLALAAPMACPVLGEKSIIHRLRSLTMNDVSSSRRKIGIAAITTTALALPLTASISYAAAENVAADQDQDQIETIDPNEETVVWVAQDEDGEVNVDVDGDGQRRVIIRRSGEEGEDGERRVFIRTVTGDGEDGEHRIVHRWVRHGEGHEMSEEEMAEVMAEVEAELAELDIEMAELDGEIAEHIELAMRHSAEAAEMARHVVFMSEEDGHVVNFSCDGDEPVVERELEDGRRALMICRAQIEAEAVSGLEEAREEIANNPDIPEEMRERILRQLERTAERMRVREVSFSAPKAPRAPVAPRVTYSFEGSAAPARAVQPVSFVSPITGEAFQVEDEEDCHHSGNA